MTSTAVSVLVLLLIPFWQQWPPGPEDLDRMRQQAQEAAAKYREQAIGLNELAGQIRTESDARKLVDGVADVLADVLPQPWATKELRARVAHAEFKTATGRLMAEERIADLWNQYVREIGAPEETLVTATEIHSLRDLKYASAKMMWSRDWNKSLWTMPDIYALGPDGKVAKGCRALEAVAVFYDLDHRIDSLRVARKYIESGTSASDEIQRAQERKSSIDRAELRVETRVVKLDSPVQDAERLFVENQGRTAMYLLLRRLADEFLQE
jgi:hypothetical protein